ncbi:Ig-like domain-containing protein [Candidatus Marinimicrobia bacterium]|nr:Ig-like domain-containing protein [Candidatus Neomarinimicrobiota bacterium]
MNDLPTTSAVSASTNEDTAKAITLVGADVEGSSLTYSIVSNPSNGSLGSVSGTGVTYTPSANFNGTDTFTYKVNDGTGDSNTSTVTITVTAINDLPTTADAASSTNEDTAKDITLSATDVEGSSLTYSIVSNVSNGSTSLSGSTVTYTPTANFNGTDTFTYKANDGTGDSNTSTVTITVAAVNDAPTVSAVSVSTNEDTPFNIALSSTDDGDPGSTTLQISFSNTGNTVPSGSTADLGDATISCSGCNGESDARTDGTATITFTPDANFNGSETFLYRAYDGGFLGPTARVNITVNAVNDLPTTSAVSASTNEDTAKAITLVGADVDTGDSLTYSIVSNPSNGSLGSVSGAGVTYTPSANFNGTDTFTYKTNDGTGDSNTSTVPSFALYVKVSVPLKLLSGV